MGPNRIVTILQFSSLLADLVNEGARHVMKSLKRIAWVFVSCLCALAQPTVTPTAVPTFTYLVNSGAFPAAQVVKVTQPATSTLPIVVVNTQVPPAPACTSTPTSCGWLSVSPSQGNTPLTLSVSINPTGL